MNSLEKKFKDNRLKTSWGKKYKRGYLRNKLDIENNKVHYYIELKKSNIIKEYTLFYIDINREFIERYNTDETFSDEILKNCGIPVGEVNARIASYVFKLAKTNRTSDGRPFLSKNKMDINLLTILAMDEYLRLQFNNTTLGIFIKLSNTKIVSMFDELSFSKSSVMNDKLSKPKPDSYKDKQTAMMSNDTLIFSIKSTEYTIKFTKHAIIERLTLRNIGMTSILKKFIPTFRIHQKKINSVDINETLIIKVKSGDYSVILTKIEKLNGIQVFKIITVIDEYDDLYTRTNDVIIEVI